MTYDSNVTAKPSQKLGLPVCYGARVIADPSEKPTFGLFSMTRVSWWRQSLAAANRAIHQIPQYDARGTRHALPAGMKHTTIETLTAEQK